jgi:DNA-directed RNA polymerase subunit M/transcription elongation factor TFIIS
MDILPFIMSLALGLGTLALILYPLWQQTRPEAVFRVDRSGQTLEEYQARYQASLAAIRDLMFDHEMGKVSAEDYQILLQKTKLEAAEIRHQIDRLSQRGEANIDPALEAEIETLLAQMKGSPLNDNETLRQEVEAEIEVLKNIKFDPTVGDLTCPNCDNLLEVGDAFCSSCGQALADHETKAEEKDVCPKCGYTFQPDDAFCAKCGTVLNETERMQRQEDAQIE